MFGSVKSMSLSHIPCKFLGYPNQNLKFSWLQTVNAFPIGIITNWSCTTDVSFLVKLFQTRNMPKTQFSRWTQIQVIVLLAKGATPPILVELIMNLAYVLDWLLIVFTKINVDWILTASPTSYWNVPIFNSIIIFGRYITQNTCQSI